jgi:CHAT domain-containing protein
VWVKLPGTGPNGTWTDVDTALPKRLTEAFAAVVLADPVVVADLTAKLSAQRIAPLVPHLAGVKRLFIAPVHHMASVPVEVLAPQYATSYVPSPTFLAKAHEAKPSATDRPATLLAVGNPVYPPANPNRDSPPPRTWKELPATAFELARLQSLFGPHAKILTRSQASVPAVEALRASGELAQFRYVHFATHGEANRAQAFNAALILAQDNLPPTVPPAGQKWHDGRLTVREVLANWKLSADLVTLSACQTGVGRSGGGDGMLGFAQAFLRVGAKSVCVSLWEVDDTATALLMDRFYANLVTRKLARGSALSEAKTWLRNLSGAEAEQRIATLTNSVVRSVEPALPKLPTVKLPATPDDRPFAHPSYWAAFILIGDPD